MSLKKPGVTSLAAAAAITLGSAGCEKTQVDLSPDSIKAIASAVAEGNNAPTDADKARDMLNKMCNNVLGSAKTASGTVVGKHTVDKYAKADKDDEVTLMCEDARTFSEEDGTLKCEKGQKDVKVCEFDTKFGVFRYPVITDADVNRIGYPSNYESAVWGDVYYPEIENHPKLGKTAGENAREVRIQVDLDPEKVVPAKVVYVPVPSKKVDPPTTPNNPTTDNKQTEHNTEDLRDLQKRVTKIEEKQNDGKIDPLKEAAMQEVCRKNPSYPQCAQ